MRDWAVASYEPWVELERDSGLPILFRCGLLTWTPPGTGIAEKVEEG